METLTTVAALRERVRAWQTAGLSVGFVPTMGFLHAGHGSLMALARPRCDRLVVSIFVNPLQFGPNEDLSRYPRDLAGDERLCAAEGVDVVFAPTDFYPPDRATTVAVAGLTEGLCGAARPGHFDGVTTVVARLFGVRERHHRRQDRAPGPAGGDPRRAPHPGSRRLGDVVAQHLPQR